DRPIHARRVSKGEVSSGSRAPATATGFAVAAVAALAAAPPADAAVVVFPARSGSAAGTGLGGAAGRAACAAAGGAAGFRGSPALVGVASALVSSAMNPRLVSHHSATQSAIHLQSAICNLTSAIS